MIAGYATSRHLLEDRNDRLLHIATTTGFGEIMYKCPINNGEGWAVFTTTGVMMVTDIHDTFIITMYFADISKTNALFHGKIPEDLLKILKANKKKGYIK